VVESDGLLVACPQCHSWPMAAARPVSRLNNSGEMIFRCAQCGHREVFILRAGIANANLPHRPYEPTDNHRLRSRTGT
jgi:RNase P subunit RPR2